MKRDLAIDATRGLAIWSMITAHFALGTTIATPSHSFPFVDGMSAFVLLSGFVLGLVYQRWIERFSLRYAFVRLGKRLVVLYLCQLLIALVAVAAAMAGHRWLTLLRPVDGWLDGIGKAVTMQYLPSGGNILLLYMVLLASAFILFPILMRNGWRWILFASVVLYLISQFAAPAWFFVTADMSEARIQNWAGWQVLFVPALVIGWNWSRWGVAEFIDRMLILIVGVAVGVALFFHYVIDNGPWQHLEPMFADKLDLGPGRAIGAWVAVPAIYGLFRVVLRWWHHDWLRPLVMTGSRSLDSYVLQAIALVIVPIHVAHRPWSDSTAAVVALLVFGMCWAWAEWRAAAGIDKLHRIPMITIDRIRPRPEPTPAVGESVSPDSAVAESPASESADPESPEPTEETPPLAGVRM